VPRLFLVHLNGSYDLLLRRLTDRKGHFFKPGLLASQLDTLEMPNAQELDAMGVRYLCIDLDAAEKRKHDDPHNLGQQIADFIAQQQGLEGR
jgi:gluconate kinase